MKYERTSAGLWIPSHARFELNGLRLSDPALLARAASGGSAPFSPSDIAGLSLWLDAAQAIRQYVFVGANIDSGGDTVTGGTGFNTYSRVGDSVYGVDGSGNIGDFIGHISTIIDDSSVFLDATAAASWSTVAVRATAINGDSVAVWPDRSGNGNDATQATSSKQPIFYSSVVNSLPVVRGDGVDDVLVSALSLAQPATYFVVVNLAGIGFQNRFLSSTNTGTGRHLLYSPAGDYALYAGANLEGGTRADGWALWSAVFNGASSALWVNGSATLSGDAGSQSQPGTTLFAESFEDHYCGCDIAEVLAYDSALSSTDRGNVEAYLAAKYGMI